MAVKTVQYIFNGTTYTLTKNTSTGKYEATVTAPNKSSYSQTDHVLGGTVKATDEAGNTTTVDQTHTTLGAALKIRVKEKVAPVVSISSPSSGAYLTSTTPTIEFTVTDADSGVASAKDHIGWNRDHFCDKNRYCRWLQIHMYTGRCA